MKTNHTLTILFFFLLTGTLHAQEYFTTTYGGSNFEELTKMRPTQDGGYVMVGSTDSYGPNAGSLGANYYIVKTDAAGLQLWSTALGGMSIDYPNDIRQTRDGGYVSFGYTTSFGSVLRAMLVRLDQNGQLLWTKSYSASTNLVGYCVFENAVGNFILAGSIVIAGNSSQANWIAETDAQGNLIHSFNYQSAFEDRITDIDTTQNGNILMCGYTATPVNNDIFIFKLDTALNAIWYVRENTSTSHIDRAHAIQELSNGNIVIAGGSSAHESNQNISDMLLYMFDSLGNAQGGFLYGQVSIYETAYDLFVDPLTKNIYASGEVSDQVHVGLTVVADSTLAMVDVVNPGFGVLAYYQRNTSIARNADRSFALAGQTNQTGNGDFFLALRDTNLSADPGCHALSLGPYSSWNAPLLWVSPLPYTPINAAVTMIGVTPQVAYGGMANYLCTTVSIEENSIENKTLRIYPNPSAGKFSIDVLHGGKFRIYDVMGREVYSRVLSEGNIEIDVELGSGYYYVSVNEYKGKLVLER